MKKIKSEKLTIGFLYFVLLYVLAQAVLGIIF